jgi:formylglycine-generating enzyme required for sulfatase activity
LPEKSALDAVWLFLVVTILAIGAAGGLLLYLDRLRSPATDQARVPQPVVVAHAQGVNPVHVVGERGGLPSEPAVGEGEKESQPPRIVQVEVKQPPAPVVQPTVWYRQEPATQPVRSSAPVEHTACLIPATSVDLDQRRRPAASPYSSLDRIVYNGLGMKLVLIPPGAFLMGSGEPANVVARIPGNNSIEHFLDEHPQRLVRITQSLYLGAYEVTTGEFAQFVDETAYRTDAEKDGQGGHGYNARASNVEGRRPEYSWRNTGFPQSGKHPVVNVSWNDATAFCTWLSRREGKHYRLPTEAEWEYACRAGTGTRYYCGDDAEGLVLAGNVFDAGARAVLPAWKNNIQQDDGYRFTAPVGEFEPNGFGLYDMHGNASEWCADRYSSTAYRLPSTDDPAGPSIGSCRAIRGGAWTNTAQACRSANRDGQPPDARTCSFGFRIAYTPRGW